VEQGGAACGHDYALVWQGAEARGKTGRMSERARVTAVRGAFASASMVRHRHMEATQRRAPEDGRP
jgi:hypothetical protein